MILNKDNLKKYALNYLNRYASSKKNLVMILSRKIKKQYPLDKKFKFIISRIINDLESDNILNDLKFANSIAYNDLRIGKSKRFIQYHLIRKGIKNDDIRTVLENLEEEFPEFEMESAMKFAKKKKLGKYGNSENVKKDLSKMIRAGFNYEIIKKILF
ncbi:MAG: hypothetical protein CMI98_00875 [Pelagibacteraceae bacterium]|nr:hypothetical protein [Pelagibacteraceae bacterium]